MSKQTKPAALPADLRRYVRRQYQKRLIWTVAWYALWGGSIGRYGQKHPEVFSLYSTWIVLVLLLAVPFAAFRLGRVLFDRPFVGEIVRIRYHRTSEISIFKEELEQVEQRNTAVLYVKPAGRRTRRLDCRRLGTVASHYYRVGDAVQYTPFLPLPQNLSYRPDDGTLCAVCGTPNDPTLTRCTRCEHSLI